MLRKLELEAYVRSRKESYPDDEAKLRGLIAANLIRLMDSVEEAKRRKQDARTEVEAIKADEDFAQHQLALEDNWSEFKHLFEESTSASADVDEFKRLKPLLDTKTEYVKDSLAVADHRIKSIRSHIVSLERDLQELRSLYE